MKTGFGLADVGAAPSQLGEQADGNGIGRREYLAVPSQFGIERTRRRAAEHRQRIARLRDLHFVLRQLRFVLRKLRFQCFDVGLAGHAMGLQALGQLKRPALVFQDGVCQGA